RVAGLRPGRQPVLVRLADGPLRDGGERVAPAPGSPCVRDSAAGMKAYLVTTGAIFGLITVAHLWRIIDEWPHLAREPGYLLLTAAAAALGLWAVRLLRPPRRPGRRRAAIAFGATDAFGAEGDTMESDTG